jgi:hypothetical protein
MCVSSAIHGRRLLSFVAQKKVTKENGNLGAAPSPSARVRYGRTGLAKRPSMASRPNRRDPSRRPRAGHAAFPSALRRGFRGDPKSQGEGAGSTLSRGRRNLGSRRFASASCFCGRDCRALLFPGPSRPRRAGGGSAACFRTRARAWRRARSRRAQGCALSEPRSLLAKSRGQGCPRDRGREGAFFFGYFLLGKQKKVTRPPGGRTKCTGT